MEKSFCFPIKEPSNKTDVIFTLHESCHSVMVPKTSENVNEKHGLAQAWFLHHFNFTKRKKNQCILE